MSEDLSTIFLDKYTLADTPINRVLASRYKKEVQDKPISEKRWGGWFTPTLKGFKFGLKWWF